MLKYATPIPEDDGKNGVGEVLEAVLGPGKEVAGSLGVQVPLEGLELGNVGQLRSRSVILSPTAPVVFILNGVGPLEVVGWQAHTKKSPHDDAPPQFRVWLRPVKEEKPTNE